VTTLAGTAASRGGTDGTSADARFYSPAGVAVDGAGNVFVADSEYRTIRMITPAGVVTTLAGTAHAIGSPDGTGAAARFNAPQGLATDVAGNVFVADSGNNKIRIITPAGVVTTLAGAAGTPGSADGTGSAARFSDPTGVAVDNEYPLHGPRLSRGGRMMQVCWHGKGKRVARENRRVAGQRAERGEIRREPRLLGTSGLALGREVTQGERRADGRSGRPLAGQVGAPK
jgi:hypothetical protein